MYKLNIYYLDQFVLIFHCIHHIIITFSTSSSTALLRLVITRG